MSQINQLSSITTFQGGDQLPVYAAANGDARRGSITLLQDYMQQNLTFTNTDYFTDYTKQYSAPAATAFNVTITDGSNDNTNVWLILTPLAGYAAGTITLPPAAGCADKQEVLVNCTQAVTALTVAANGAAAVIGAPTGLAANAFFRLKYDLATTNWYRVG